MLKPFRIRDLLNDDEDRSGDDVVVKSNENPNLEPRDGVVQVTSSQYDDTIARNPEARLSYVDEDDGEVILVGSSLELSQRLDEPVPQWLTNTFAPGGTLHDDDDPSPMHIFDIRRSPDVLKTWADIHSKTHSEPVSSNAVRMFFGQDVASVDTAAPGCNAGASLLDSPADVTSTQTSDLFGVRGRWVQHCEPPQLHIAVPAPKAEDDAQDEMSIADGNASEPCGIAIGSESPTGCITEEGRRQAKAAGAKLRGSRNLFSDSRPSPPLRSPGNFWSTYSHGEKAHNSDYERLSEREPKSNESPVDEKSLFNAFEAELAKLMSESATEEQQPAAEASSQSDAQQAEPASSGQDRPQSDAQQAGPASSGQDSFCQGAIGPGDVAALTLHTLLSGIAHVTTDLKTRIPEVERRLVSLQQHVPEQIETRVNTALHGMKNHVQTLANAMQETARSTRTAAERSRDSEVLASGQVDALRNLSHDLGEMGKTVFAAFESRVAGVGAQNPQLVNESSEAAVPSNPGGQEGNSDRLPLDSEALPPSTEGRRPLSSDPPSSTVPKTTLFVGNVSPDATESMLYNAFVSQGFLGSLTLCKDSTTGKHAGFGHIEFPSTYAASGGLQALQGTNLCGQPLNLEFSHDVARASPVHALKPISESDTDATAEYKHCGFGRRHSSLRASRGLRDAGYRQRPNASFVAPPDAPGDSANVRRPKSLGTLRSRHIAREIRREDGIGPLVAPKVPPKERHNSENEVDQQEKAINTIPETNTTLMDEDHTNAEFSARYPSISTLLNPTNNQASADLDEPRGPRHSPEGEQSIISEQVSRSSPPPALMDTLPGTFPSDPAPEQRDTTAEQPAYRQNPRFSTTGAPRPLPGLQPPWAWNPSRPPFPSIRRSATERRGTRMDPREAILRGRDNRRHHEYPLLHLPNTPGAFPVESQFDGSHPLHSDRSRQPEMAENHSKSGIDLCVGHLKALGFANGDMARLRIYAEAVDGNLGDAIEMIEEERKVLEQHGGALS